MNAFKKIIFTSMLVLLQIIFISCNRKDLEIAKTEYKYYGDSLCIKVEMKNISDEVLLFPSSMRNQIRNLKKGGNKITINECNVNFKNVKELIEFQNSEISLDDEEHTDILSCLYVNPVYPGHKCVNESFIDFSEIPKEEMQNKKINIILKYGKSNNYKIEKMMVVSAEGKMCSDSITIDLAKTNEIIQFSIPTVIQGPVWDVEAVPFL